MRILQPNYEKKKKKTRVGNNGKGMLKLPFQNGAPIQRQF